MKITKVVDGYAHKKVWANLEGDEYFLPTPVLVMMADGRSEKEAKVIYDEKKHPGHFGYRDNWKREGHDQTPDTFFVTIYTD